jgi:hypothetical protein
MSVVANSLPQLPWLTRYVGRDALIRVCSSCQVVFWHLRRILHKTGSAWTEVVFAAILVSTIIRCSYCVPIALLLISKRDQMAGAVGPRETGTRWRVPPPREAWRVRLHAARSRVCPIRLLVRWHVVRPGHSTALSVSPIRFTSMETQSPNFSDEWLPHLGSNFSSKTTWWMFSVVFVIHSR